MSSVVWSAWPLWALLLFLTFSTLTRPHLLRLPLYSSRTENESIVLGSFLFRKSVKMQTATCEPIVVACSFQKHSRLETSSKGCGLRVAPKLKEADNFANLKCVCEPFHRSSVFLLPRFPNSLFFVTVYWWREGEEELSGSVGEEMKRKMKRKRLAHTG